MGSFTGGARFGMANATWPLATLTVTQDTLSIRATILGTHTFTADHVLEIKAISWVPIIGQGVQVIHTRREIPERIIFWTLGSPKTILADIELEGFKAQALPEEDQEFRHFPLRVWFMVLAFFLWNGLMLTDLILLITESGDTAYATSAAISLAFFTSLAIRFPGPIQRFALHEPDDLSRIQSTLNIVSFALFIMMLSLPWMTLA